MFCWGHILQAQLNNAEKGSKEEEKLLKKQFQVNKAFQTANAVINGIQAIQAIQATAVDPTGITTALRIGASVALTAANLAKIQSARFQSSATVQAPSIPTISTPLYSSTSSFRANRFNIVKGRWYGSCSNTTNTNYKSCSSGD